MVPTRGLKSSRRLDSSPGEVHLRKGQSTGPSLFPSSLQMCVTCNKSILQHSKAGSCCLCIGFHFVWEQQAYFL